MLDVLGVRWSSRLDHCVGAAVRLCRRLTSAPVLGDFNIDVGPSIVPGQLDSLPGVSNEEDLGRPPTWSAITSIPDANAATLIMLILCVAAFISMKRWLWRVPGQSSSWP